MLIRFHLSSGDQPVTCDKPLAGFTGKGAPVRLRDARLYVSEIQLTNEQNISIPLILPPSQWQSRETALLDFEDGSETCKGGTSGLHTVVDGSLPKGRYKGLTFTVGVPVLGLDKQGKTYSPNHSDTVSAPPPLDNQAMGWSWQLGRKFIKIEVMPTGGISRPNGSMASVWTVHLGSTGCKGNPVNNEAVSCTRSNRIVITLPEFEPGNQVVGIDLDKLFQGSDLTTDKGMASGCMSAPGDPECQPLFESLGLNIESGNSNPSKPQRVFYALPDQIAP